MSAAGLIPTVAGHANEDGFGVVTSDHVSPRSVLRINRDRFPVRILPIDLCADPWPVAVVTLKNRTLSPVVKLFVDHLRDFVNTNVTGRQPARVSAPAT